MSTKRARTLRRNSTEAETRLWNRVRRNQLDGHHFRRQLPIGPYIIDFACSTQSLVVEVDGGQHSGRIEQDITRTAYLDEQGFRVLRFWNNEVLDNTDGVVEVILSALREE